MDLHFSDVQRGQWRSLTIPDTLRTGFSHRQKRLFHEERHHLLGGL